MNNKKHKASPKTTARVKELRDIRARYQRDKPDIDQLLAEGDQQSTVTLSALLIVHQLMHRLRQERVKQQWTLVQLAEYSGIETATLSRLEAGREANPTLDTLNRIALALGKELVCDTCDCVVPAPRGRPNAASRAKARPRKSRTA